MVLFLAHELAQARLERAVVAPDVEQDILVNEAVHQPYLTLLRSGWRIRTVRR